MLTMKKILSVFAISAILFACNPNNQQNDNVNRDTTDYGNAGMSGSTNANGLLPADSNKSIHPGGQTGTDTMNRRDSMDQ